MNLSYVAKLEEEKVVTPGRRGCSLAGAPQPQTSVVRGAGISQSSENFWHRLTGEISVIGEAAASFVGGWSSSSCGCC